MELTHDPSYPPDDCYRLAFVELWESINGERASWYHNPTVQVITFANDLKTFGEWDG